MSVHTGGRFKRAADVKLGKSGRSHGTHRKSDRDKIERAFSEIAKNPPSTLEPGNEAQRVAIGLSKARKRGAHIPRPRR